MPAPMNRRMSFSRKGNGCEAEHRAARAKLRAEQRARADVAAPARCELRRDTTGEHVCRLCHVRIDPGDAPDFACPRAREPA